MHFVAEAARWAMDYCKVGFVEDAYLPILHSFGVLLNGLPYMSFKGSKGTTLSNQIRVFSSILTSSQ